MKTQQELIIPLSDEAEACLERSTRCRLAELDREKETPLFAALPSSRLNEKLRAWLREAGITDKHITFHSGRHTFATQALAMGVDIYTVSQLLGHTHISTTQVYVHSLLQKKQEAIRLIAGMAA